MQKLCDKAKPNAIIPLTKNEMRLYISNDFQILHLDEEAKSVIEIDPSRSYVFMIDPCRQSLDDTAALIDKLSLNAGIIRC